MHKLITALIVTLSLISVSEAQMLTPQQATKAICRIRVELTKPLEPTAKYSYGSGTVYGKDSAYYYIMTNGHVVSGGGKYATCEFFHAGRKGEPVVGEITWTAYDANTSKDMSVIRIPIPNMGGYQPVIIPLASNVRLTPNSYIFGVGCPRGLWAQMWEGRVLTNDDHIMYFNPPPIEGQSGSAILSNIPNRQGGADTRIVGIVTWRLTEETNGTVGGGPNLAQLQKLFAGDIRTNSRIPARYLPKEAADKEGIPFYSPSKEVVIDKNGKRVYTDSIDTIKFIQDKRNLDAICDYCGYKLRDHYCSQHNLQNCVGEQCLPFFCPRRRQQPPRIGPAPNPQPQDPIDGGGSPAPIPVEPPNGMPPNMPTEPLPPELDPMAKLDNILKEIVGIRDFVKDSGKLEDILNKLGLTGDQVKTILSKVDENITRIDNLREAVGTKEDGEKYEPSTFWTSVIGAATGGSGLTAILMALYARFVGSRLGGLGLKGKILNTVLKRKLEALAKEKEEDLVGELLEQVKGRLGKRFGGGEEKPPVVPVVPVPVVPTPPTDVVP